jgi:peptide/nickel transport system ATP-binding protein
METAAGSTELIEVSDLSCAYGRQRGGWWHPQPQRVVDTVSFSMPAHQTFALVGESGSGKSTIARAVGGLLQPVAGKIRFAGNDITRPVQQRERRLHRDIQLVLQNPDASLNPRQKILHIIGRPLTLFYGLKGKALHERVDQLLEDVRLDRSYAGRYPDQLSGGERQRVAIARALGSEPELVLCDEILSALDVSVQADVLDLLRDLQNRRGVTYLFISHDLAVVRALAHRVGVLYRGRLVEYGAVEEVYRAPVHPYTAMLLAAVPEIDTEAAAYQAPADATALPADVHTDLCPFVDRCPWRIEPLCLESMPPWRPTSTSHSLRCHWPAQELTAREAAIFVNQPNPSVN